MARYIVYDIETISNLFTACFMDVDSGKKRDFVVHYSRNDLKPLVEFLQACKHHDCTMVGFNNVAFDAQVLDWILIHYKTLSQIKDPAEAIYQEAQRVLTIPEKERFMHTIPEWKLYLSQIDLYKQKHYDGKAKRTSLKWLEYTMRRNTIKEMPIEHTSKVETNGIGEVLDYNWEDVDATKEFFVLNKYETDLRLKLSEQFGLPLMNASEPRMAREILASLLAEDMGIPIKEVKAKRTFRKEIHLGKCILPVVQFDDECFKELVSKLRGTTINPLQTKNAFMHTIEYKGITIDYGVGGVHGCVGSGVYVSDDSYVIKSVDVTSFYPMLIINNGFAPAHLGDTFANRYRWFFDERQKISKKDPINYIYKIILNSTYGLSNDMNSFLYDTLTTMNTTINGQLLLTMLAERLGKIEDSQLIMMNTDGLEIRIPRKYEEQFNSICQEWQTLTALKLEHEEYKKMIIGDVNNYIAVSSDRICPEKEWAELQKKEPFYVFGNGHTYNPVKMKGRFELKIEYHKNPSGRIIPLAVYEHFVNHKAVEETVNNCDNIHEFCYGVKKRSDFELVLHSIVNGEHIKERQQKVTRYYISNRGGKLVKEYKDGRRMLVSAEEYVTPLNRIDNHIADLDLAYYIKAAYREINNIQPTTTQLSLFN